jgi:GntR family transcriptional regulator
MTKQEVTRQRVLELIEQLAVGDPIPPERRLAGELGVSRLTLRAALDELAREGLIVRRRGSGSFVSEPKIAQQIGLTSFTEDMRRRSLTPGTRLVEMETIHAGARLGRALHVSPGDQVVRVLRLRLADGEPMAVEDLYVTASLIPGLTRADLENASFYALLRERYGITVARGIQVIEPTVTSQQEASLLGVPLHSPALMFERTTQSDDGRIVEFVRSVYRGDRYRIVTELSPPVSGQPEIVRAIDANGVSFGS